MPITDLDELVTATNEGSLKIVVNPAGGSVTPMEART